MNREEFEEYFKTKVKPIARRFREWVAGKPTAFWLMAAFAAWKLGDLALAVARWLA